MKNVAKKNLKRIKRVLLFTHSVCKCSGGNGVLYVPYKTQNYLIMKFKIHIYFKSSLNCPKPWDQRARSLLKILGPVYIN